jgi:steroid 5-alpha reductase family enzyme
MTTLNRISSVDSLLADLDRSELIPTVRNALNELFQARVWATLVVIGWGAWISYRIYQSDTATSEDDKYVQMHRIWFGTRPLFEALFNAWATSIVVAIIMRAAAKWFRAT